MLKAFAARRTVVSVNNGFAIILNAEYNGSMDMYSGKTRQAIELAEDFNG